MKTVLSFVFSIVLACFAAPLAHAQNSAPPPCQGEEFHQLDFWLGEWDASWEASGSTPAGSGTNAITRQLGDCVIQEDFVADASVGGLIGRSVSLYDARAGAWRQTWVDNQGGYFALVGGPEEGGSVFELTMTRISEEAPHLRMRFEDIEENSFIWRWQRSSDAESWTDLWVISYHRRDSGS